MQVSVKSSQQVIKEANTKLVFGFIHKHGPISRADIKKNTKLSATTVSSLVEELLADGFISETGIKNTSTSGRKAVLLSVNPDGGYFVGIDIKSGVISADTYALDFTPVFHMDIPISQNENPALNVLRALSSASKDKNILGITIGLPGVVDVATNSVISSTVIDAETVKDIYRTVSEAMPNTKLNLRNNSGLVAYAEKEFGVHGDVDNLISIDIDDGVGAGIVIGGLIHSGAKGMAGEFGHITIDYKGDKCKCGNYGCLELAASIPAILKKSNSKSLTEVCEKLSSGDKLTLDTIDDVARALAFGINNINNIVDPQFIVICGPVRVLGDFLLTPLQKYIDSISLNKNKPIKYSTIKDNAVTLGGARVAFDEMFRV